MIRHFKKIVISFFCLGLVVAAAPVRAHLYGASLEKEVDGYFIDIGHSEYTLEVGDSVRFDFNLFQKDDRNIPVDFSDMWVRISQENKSIFAGGLAKPQLGRTGMTIVFPEPGEYELYARYHDQDQTLVETTFPLSVEPDPALTKQKRTRLMLGTFIGVVTLFTSFLIGLLVAKYKPKKKDDTSKK